MFFIYSWYHKKYELSQFKRQLYFYSSKTPFMLHFARYIRANTVDRSIFKCASPKTLSHPCPFHTLTTSCSCAASVHNTAAPQSSHLAVSDIISPLAQSTFKEELKVLLIPRNRWRKKWHPDGKTTHHPQPGRRRHSPALSRLYMI